MVKRHYGISTARYKLMHFYYDIDEWEMYDLEKDPEEINNVYNDPSYAGIRESMHVKLKNIRASYGDSEAMDQKFIDLFKAYMEKRSSPK
jgi:hypothetical protein